MVFQLDFTSAAGSGLLADDATPACFVAGTLIGTPLGKRPVEQLAIGTCWLPPRDSTVRR